MTRETGLTLIQSCVRPDCPSCVKKMGAGQARLRPSSVPRLLSDTCKRELEGFPSCSGVPCLVCHGGRPMQKV